MCRFYKKFLCIGRARVIKLYIFVYKIKNNNNVIGDNKKLSARLKIATYIASLLYFNRKILIWELNLALFYEEQFNLFLFLFARI